MRRPKHGKGLCVVIDLLIRKALAGHSSAAGEATVKLHLTSELQPRALDLPPLE